MPGHAGEYTEIKEMDAEIIRTLVERIDVFMLEKAPGTGTKKQTILIHWNFIGAAELPQEQKNQHSRLSLNDANFSGIKIPS